MRCLGRSVSLLYSAQDKMQLHPFGFEVSFIITDRVTYNFYSVPC